MTPEHQIRRPWSRSERAVPRRVVRPLREFARWEASGGLVMLAATIAALAWANADAESYERLFTTGLDVAFGGTAVGMDVRHVINDGLMTLFFLLIGLEVKRELSVGELSTRRAAALPLFAAVGGLVVPALVYLAIAGGAGGAAADGWGIPIATDTAFALGVLALLARRAPPALTALLLGVAVIDDLGAMAVMTLFYSDGPDPLWLAAAAASIAAMPVMARAHVRMLLPYIVAGGLAWACALAAGMHPTIVGVIVGLLTPARPFQPRIGVAREAGAVAAEILGGSERREADAKPWRRLAHLTREAISPLNRIEHALLPWTSMVVVPVFALANAGIVLDGASLQAAADSRVTLGIVAGLVVGKPLGLVVGAALAVRLGLSRRPPGVGWVHLAGLGGIAGIGFTISLFVTSLAFDDPALLAAAKVGIMAGSIVAALAGGGVLLAAHLRGRARAAAPA